MNPLASAAIGSIIRWALALGAGYLVTAGIWTRSDADTYIVTGTLALLSLGWSLYEKWRRHELDMSWWPYHRKVVILAVLGGSLMWAAPARAQAGTEPLAWEPEHRALADALGTAAVAAQLGADTIKSVRAWKDGDHKTAFRQLCSDDGAALTAQLLKMAVREDRPNGVDNRSFPSMHSALAAASSGWRFEFGVPVMIFAGLSRSASNWHHLGGLERPRTFRSDGGSGLVRRRRVTR